MARAFVFPGQGSQDVGMGRELAETFAAAREVFDEVDDALGQKLSAIMWDGPKDTLTLTENAQPALMAVSMAVVRVLERERGIRLADTARLLKLRGQAMQAAVPVGEGAMVALLGVGLDVAEKVAAEAAQGDVCQVANDNDPTQVVLSGTKAAMDRVLEIAKSHGVRRALPLPVSAPFHCALMQPAADAMADALSKVEVKAPVVPVVANVLATPLSDPDEIRRRLVQQVTGTVRWRECVSFMAGNGVTHVYELGSGKVLSGLARRIVSTLEAASISGPEDVDAVAPALT